MTSTTCSTASSAVHPGPGPGALPARHRWKVLAAGVCANAAFSVAFSGIPMTAVLMRSGYQLDAGTLGLMLGLMGLGIALSEMPWGVLTDRWGDRPVLLAGLGGTALALAAMALWAAPPAAGQVPPLPRLAAGWCWSACWEAASTAPGAGHMLWFSDGERGLAMSIRQTAVPLGGAWARCCCPRWRCTSASPPCTACWLRCACWRRCSRRPGCAIPCGRPAAPHAAPAKARPGGPLRDARAWRLAAGIGVSCAPQFAVLSFGSVFLHDFARIGLGAIAVAMAAVQVGAMALRVWSGRWTDRRRKTAPPICAAAAP